MVKRIARLAAVIFVSVVLAAAACPASDGECNPDQKTFEECLENGGLSPDCSCAYDEGDSSNHGKKKSRTKRQSDRS